MKIGKTMNKKLTKKVGGVLGQMLAEPDNKVLARTQNRMLIAAKIDMALKRKGLSQKRFAAIMGRTESEISDWLSGDRNFTIDTLTDISEELNVEILNTSLVNMYKISNSNISCKIKSGKGQVYITHDFKWQSIPVEKSVSLDVEQKVS